jgi:hypothetical protein
MLTVDESIRLMSSGWVEEIHIPESYLEFSDVLHVIQHYRWMFIASQSPGWVCLRRHVGYHD